MFEIKKLKVPKNSDHSFPMRILPYDQRPHWVGPPQLAQVEASGPGHVQRLPMNCFLVLQEMKELGKKLHCCQLGRSQVEIHVSTLPI